MQPWKTLARQKVVQFGHYLTVESHTVALPDGRIIEEWPWVVTPDYVIVVAVTADGHFLCFRQTKYAIEGTTLAVVGGYLEPGEEALGAAQRELQEETGYVAPTWHSLGRYVVDGNRGAGCAHLFLAQGAVPVAEIHADDLEEQQMLLLSRKEVETALDTGEFKGLAWAAAMALALRKLA